MPEMSVREDKVRERARRRCQEIHDCIAEVNRNIAKLKQYSLRHPASGIYEEIKALEQSRDELLGLVEILRTRCGVL